MMSAVYNEVVVLDIGGTKIRIGHIINAQVASASHAVESQRLRVTDARAVLVSIIRDYIRTNALTPDAVVLGIPAILDPLHDTISHCNNIQTLEGQGLVAALEAALQCRVMLQQDIMLQLLGEWYAGSAKNSDAVFALYFGTGIGAAYLQQGDPFRRGAATLQAGHIPLPISATRAGKLCVCGNIDCIEAHACGHTLVELAQSSGVPVDQLFVERDRPELSESVSEFIRYQAYLIATVATLLEPEVILLGGGIPDMAGYPREELINTAREHLTKPYPAENIQFRWASLGSTAPHHGAKALLNINTH